MLIKICLQSMMNVYSNHSFVVVRNIKIIIIMIEEVFIIDIMCQLYCLREREREKQRESESLEKNKCCHAFIVIINKGIYRFTEKVVSSLNALLYFVQDFDIESIFIDNTNVQQNYNFLVQGQQ